MRWTLLVTLMAGASMAAVSKVVAQAASPTAAKPANPKLAGMWEGTFTSDGPSGGMTLELVKGASWTVKAAITGSDAPPGGDVRDIAVNGDEVTWKQSYGEFDVAFKATLSADGSQITGTLEATQGGSYVGGGTFSLARKT